MGHLYKRRDAEGWWVIRSNGTPKGEQLQRFENEKDAQAYINYLQMIGNREYEPPLETTVIYTFGGQSQRYHQPIWMNYEENRFTSRQVYIQSACGLLDSRTWNFIQSTLKKLKTTEYGKKLTPCKNCW